MLPFRPSQAISRVHATAPAEITTAIRHVHRTFNGPVNAAVQRAALTALRLGPEIAAPMFKAYQERLLRVRPLRRRPAVDVSDALPP
ncbi:hypothetical protein [Streptomyces brasiliscabiei]|uniref:hypothetical protein n=1 Tax=Streptomyces brasiliscabiei TaxID=2736302 RepID=UPI001C108EF6|nr:hypothetical protein [Streptomyces brasiliscabiei]